MGKNLKGKELGKGISQRKDGTYMARFTSKWGKRKTTYDMNLTSLRRALRKDQYEDETGVNIIVESYTLEEWSLVWLNKYKYGVRPVTRKNYIQYLTIINSEMGGKGLTEIRQIDVIGLVESMHSDDYAKSTIKIVKGVLSDVLQKALDNEYISKNPAKGIKVIGKEKKSIKVLTVEQEAIFLRSVENTQYMEMYQIMLLTGLRIGEVVGLRWCDINWKKKQMKIRRGLIFMKIADDYEFVLTPTKTSSSQRDIPLTETTIGLLKQQKKKILMNSKRRESLMIWYS